LNGNGDNFYDHLLKKEHLPIVRISGEQSWPSFFLIACLLLLVFVKIRALPRVMRIIQSTFSPQILQQLEREERNPFKFYSLALNILFLLNVSFLFYKINSYYNLVLPGSDRLVQFLFFVGIIFMMFGLKSIANWILAFFTGDPGLFSEYSISATLINQTFGLFLFPWIVLLEFSSLNPSVFLSVALIILAFSVLLKWYRGIKMGLIEERIGLLQIFSYFCGLEILPVLVMVKYLVETF
jgi:MFS family permease